MSDDKSRPGDKPSDIARNIWLAGLGAYGRAVRDAQGKLEEAAKEPPRLFRELVEKGTKLDAEVRDSLANIRKSGGMSVEERINRVRETFNLNLGRGDELEALHDKLDALAAKVDALAARLDGSAPPKRKATPRRSTAKVPRKAPKKKAGTNARAKSAKKAARKTPKKAPVKSTRAAAKAAGRKPTAKKKSASR